MPAPTPQQICDEIQDADGPLFALYAPHWADVFADKKLEMRSKLAYRQGMLKADAANAIYQIMNDRSHNRTRVVAKIPRGEFLSLLAPFVLRVADMEEVKREAWKLTITLLSSTADAVDLLQPGIQSILDQAVRDGLLSAKERELFAAQIVPCSRIEELGWTGFHYELIVTARSLVR